MNNRFCIWITSFAIILSFLCFMIASFTYQIDPMWCFVHSNRYNSRQLPFEPRQQKANYLVARPAAYDALILGSSRLNMIIQRDIKDYTAFNGSVASMLPDEYADYVNFAKRHNKADIKLIILGVDFFSSNTNFKGYGHKTPDHYFQNAENRLYRFKTLLTWDALNYSFKNVQQLSSPTAHVHYDRYNNLMETYPIPAKLRAARIAKDLVEFDRYLYGKTYQYHDIKPQLRRLREQNKSCNFVVFTTPESKPLWDYQLRAGRLEDYLCWLGDLIEVFGSVYDFMGENELTTNLDNFHDAHHITPLAAKKLITRILDDSQKNKRVVGTLLTKNNFAPYAAAVRAKYISQSVNAPQKQ